PSPPPRPPLPLHASLPILEVEEVSAPPCSPGEPGGREHRGHQRPRRGPVTLPEAAGRDLVVEAVAHAGLTHRLDDPLGHELPRLDRQSPRLNSSHVSLSYA